MAFTAVLLVLSCFAMNLTMNFGIGLNWTATAGRKVLINYFKRLSIFFPVIIILWLIITFIRSLFNTGSIEYIFLFPVCYAVYYALDSVIPRFIFKKSNEGDAASVIHTSAVITTVALFIILNITGNFWVVFALALGFLLGIIMTMIIIAEIRMRAELEKTPHFLKGIPLSLITIGLLSLVYSSAAMMFFRILGEG